LNQRDHCIAPAPYGRPGGLTQTTSRRPDRRAGADPDPKTAGKTAKRADLEALAARDLEEFFALLSANAPGADALNDLIEDQVEALVEEYEEELRQYDDEQLSEEGQSVS
jgi:hypothetical protein